MGVNKVVFGDETLVDLTSDTVTPDTLVKGATAHDASGERITGTYEGEDVSAETADYTEKLSAQDELLLQIKDTLAVKFARPSALQNKTVTPSASIQTVMPDSGYDGLSKVTINAIPQSILDAEYQKGYDEAFELYKPYKQELAYIQSSGTQYIDTGFKPNQDTRVIVDVELPAQTSYPTALFGGRNGDTSREDSCAVWLISATQFQLDFDTGAVKVAITPVGRFVIDKNKTVTTINGSVYTNTASTFQGNYNLALFTQIDSGGKDTRMTACELYGAKVYDNGTLIRDYIPVLDWDDVPCLYDKVKRKLYYNAGTGSFAYA